MNSPIKAVTLNEIYLIASIRKPEGLYISYDGGRFVGCDNTTGDAWLESFRTQDECLRWLRQEGEYSDIVS